MNRIYDIIKLEAEADKLSEEYENNRWETARLISDELASGTSQRQLASQVGKSQMHISRMNTVWQRNARVSLEDRPSFTEAYNAANPRGEHKSKPKPEPEPEDDWQPRPEPEPEDEKSNEERRRFNERRRREEEKQEQERTAGGWTLRIAAEVSKLYQYEKLWPALSEINLAKLEESKAMIESIIEGARKCTSMSGRRSTSSRAKAE